MEPAVVSGTVTISYQRSYIKIETLRGKNPTEIHGALTLIVPRGREIGSKQPCIKGRKTRQLILFIFEFVKLPPLHIWNNLHKLQKQGQSLHISKTSPSTTGCYKNKYTIQFLSMPCISRSACGNFKR